MKHAPEVVKKDLRVIGEKFNYYITEVGYDDKGDPISFLGPECGILSYWETYEKLQESFMQVVEAFNKPIIQK